MQLEEANQIKQENINKCIALEDEIEQLKNLNRPLSPYPICDSFCLTEAAANLSEMNIIESNTIFATINTKSCIISIN